MVILFNKPFGVLSQFTPEGGHPALDTFGFPSEVYATGRLDHDSEGALLLTDNGKLIRILKHGRKAKSIFRYGLDILTEFLVCGRNNHQLQFFDFLIINEKRLDRAG